MGVLREEPECTQQPAVTVRMLSSVFAAAGAGSATGLGPTRQPGRVATARPPDTSIRPSCRLSSLGFVTFGR